MTPNFSAKVGAEKQRLAEDKAGRQNWRRWGPYLSERQWGTVREDYSPGGTAWEYFPHDHARSRAYRWGEDGLAGFSDDMQHLCLSLALWNGKDPDSQGTTFWPHQRRGQSRRGREGTLLLPRRHADALVSEILYKYPQEEFPYAQLIEENRRRGEDQPEFELLDTGLFDADRYFDVFVEYAKAAPDDILMLVTVHNRGPETAQAHAAAATLFPQYLVVDSECGTNQNFSAENGGVKIEHRPTRQFSPRLRWQTGSAFLRQRNQCAPALRSGGRKRFFQGRFSRICGRRK